MNRIIISKALKLLKEICSDDNGTYTCSGGLDYFKSALEKLKVPANEISIYVYWSECHGAPCDCALLEMADDVCKTCFGYGLWCMGAPSPMGPMDAKDGMPTAKCQECGKGGGEK